ncbi:MAG: LLM class flavin-dependent oxidoreductase, partial [Burkholderiales bacterium]
YPYTEIDRQRIAHHRRRVVLGTPDVVKQRLLEIQAEFAADELMVITITGDYDTRLHSYELVAGAFGLCHP